LWRGGHPGSSRHRGSDRGGAAGQRQDPPEAAAPQRAQSPPATGRRETPGPDGPLNR
jgi:hypothetical protein